MLIKLLPLTLAIFCVGVTQSGVLGIIPVVADDLDISLAASAQMATAFSLTFALAAPLMSAVYSSLSRQKALGISLAIFLVGNVCAALAPNYAVLIVARAVTAIGAGAINSTAMSAGAEIAGPQRRGRALAITFSGLTVSTAIGTPIGAWLGGYDWRIVFWFVAGLSVLAIIGVLSSVRVAAPPPLPLRERFRPLGSSWVMRVLLVTVLTVAGGYVFYALIAVSAGQVVGYDQNLLALVLLVAGPFAVVGSAVAGTLTDRFPARRLLVGGVTGNLLLLLLSPLMIQTLPSAVAWLILWGLISSTWVIPQQQRLLTYSVDLSPVLLGLNSACIAIGVATGSMLAGVLLGWVPAAMLGLPGALVILIGLILVLTTGPAPTRTTNETAPKHDADPSPAT